MYFFKDDMVKSKTPKKFLKEPKTKISKKELLTEMEKEAKRVGKNKKEVKPTTQRFTKRKCKQCKDTFEAEFPTTVICPECEFKNSQ